jgi:preprotein translocase subunit Sss1
MGFVGIVAAPVDSAVETSCARPTAFGPDTAFGSDRRVRTLPQAVAQVAFEPRLPAGRPYRVYVSTDKAVAERSLTVVYLVKGGSWFRVMQVLSPDWPGPVPWEQYVQGTVAHPAPCLRSREAVKLRNGELGLLMTGDERITLHVRADGLFFMLQTSPSGGVSTSQLIEFGSFLANPARVTVMAGKPSEHEFTLSKKAVPVGTVVFTVVNMGKKRHDFTIAG